MFAQNISIISNFSFFSYEQKSKLKEDENAETSNTKKGTLFIPENNPTGTVFAEQFECFEFISVMDQKYCRTFTLEVQANKHEIFNSIPKRLISDYLQDFYFGNFNHYGHDTSIDNYPE